MDLLDFTNCQLYFEEPLPQEVADLMTKASNHIGQPEAEQALLYAHFLAPEHLMVLAALYRYYFSQRRLQETLVVAERALQLSARRLELPEDWRMLNERNMGTAASLSFGLLRFYLLALKASGVVLLRLRRISEAQQRLVKLQSLDSQDQMGVTRLLAAVNAFQPNALASV